MFATLTQDLKAAWAAYREAHPGVRIRNAADALGVSEVELLATRCGEGVTRLDADWGVLLGELEALGYVMALTRNASCVHEKKGYYRNVKIFKASQMGVVLDPAIDLRMFMNAWHFGFAVEQETQMGTRRSIQFFNQDGAAVHKTYLTRKSDINVYNALVDKYRHADQSPTQVVTPLDPVDAELPDSEIDTEGFLQGWADLEDTHDFYGLTKKFEVTRTQALRLGNARFTRPVAADSVRHILQQASEHQVEIMVFVGNHGCIQIHTGPVKKLKEHGPWYNVLDPGFNLHLKESEIAEAWVVEKPTVDGTVTALEIFDATGWSIATFFGKRKPGSNELETWRAILGEIPTLESAEV